MSDKAARLYSMVRFIQEHKTAFQSVSLALLTVLVLGGIAAFALCDVEHLTVTKMFNASTNLICLIALSIICISIFIDLKNSQHRTFDAIYFAGMLLAQCIALFCIENAVINADRPEAALSILISHTLVYIFTDTVVFLWWRYLSLQCADLPRWHAPVSKILDVLFVLTVIASLSNIFGSNVFFSIDAQGSYHRSSTYILCMVYTLTCFIASAILLACQKNMAWGNRLALFCYILLPIIAAIMQFFSFGITLTYIATSFAMTFVFGSVFVERGKNVLRKEAELAEQRKDIMLSQIKPHFLYNSLTAIADLCDEDPEKAQNLTLEFATYLRGNMDSIDEKKPIPFPRELSHTKSYLKIEQTRFGDKLNIVYDTPVTNFSIPALTLQPIVENAVKHGVKNKRGPGTVTISTRQCDDEIQICVQDDGLGFDVDAIKDEKEGRSHKGIDNVGSRLKSMVDGSFEITSDKTTGTCATLHIPCRRENK